MNLAHVLTIAYNSIKPYIPNILWIIFVVAATSLILRSFNRIIRHLYKRYKIPKRNYLIVRNAVLFAIHFTAVVLILLSVPGVDTKILTLIGIGVGIIASFSSTSTVGNFVAGMIIQLTRPITEGDRVELAGVEGDVLSIEMLFVHIRTYRNQVISIPCMQVLNSTIINYSQMENVTVAVTTSIGYNIGQGKVKNLLTKAATDTEGIIKDPKPYVLINNLGSYYITYELNAYTNHSHLLEKISSNLRESILKTFAHEGVEILSPMYVNMYQRAAKDRALPRKEDTAVSQHKVIDHHENIEELHEAKEKLAERKRSAGSIEELHKDEHRKEKKADG